MSPAGQPQFTSQALSERLQLRQLERRYCYVHLGEKVALLVERLLQLTAHDGPGKQYHYDPRFSGEELEACPQPQISK